MLEQVVVVELVPLAALEFNLTLTLMIGTDTE
jgi:hypothetical protein